MQEQTTNVILSEAKNLLSISLAPTNQPQILRAAQDDTAVSEQLSSATSATSRIAVILTEAKDLRLTFPSPSPAHA